MSDEITTSQEVTETPAEAPAQEAAQEEVSFADLMAQQEAAQQVRVQVGQKVQGTVIEVTDDTVFVNIGAKIDGIMDRKDFLDSEGNMDIAAGDPIEAYITRANSQEIVLSRSMGGTGMAAIEQAKDSGVPVDGRVIETCKGGYHVEVLGKTAFCPGSQMAAGSAEALIGTTLQFIITRVESRGRNIVVSHRALADRQREANLARLLEDVREGDVIEGRVTRLAPFGAFVELVPGVEGMVHLSELSWSRIMKADEVVKVDDTVQAKILKISKEKGRDGNEHTRISLSIKAALGNPWDDVEHNLPAPGSIVEGKVMRLAPFGAFVEVCPGIEGLVHLSEMSWTKRVNRPEEILKPGDVVAVKIKEINAENRRVSLSLRDAQEDPWADVETKFPVGSIVEGTVESQSKFGLFVCLAPGITGLLPEAIMRATKTAAQFQKLEKDSPVTLEVQRVDAVARRITLVPEGAQQEQQPREKREGGERKGGKKGEDQSWRQHQKTEAAADGGLNLMAQALQKAMQNKQ
ncbi:MAG: S1 RNA-binding domain-containing protein [Desulfovibrionaceae bacterium]|nr:S1 RNA-binding domain-containing protein [Desulfovibrionaceae bacterium]